LRYCKLQTTNYLLMNKQLNFQEIRENSAERIANIKHNRAPIALLCDRMTDFRNIGSMFRIADAARLEKIYFYQSDINFKHKKIGKVARSTNQYVDFEIINDIQLIAKLKEEYQIIALDKTSKSMDYIDFKPPINQKILLLIGAEKFGVSEELLALVTTAIHLPMLGVNTSMNVGVATGIAVFDLLKKVPL
jgi:23S rRNA (guanosine2251-2'-O)-methyltransferase